MAEYIERESLLDDINSVPVSMSICMNVDECKGRIYERERLVRIINEATAADVVPVVRCKDCRYSQPWYSDKRLCELWSKNVIDVFDDGFCNYGERGEEQ